MSSRALAGIIRSTTARGPNGGRETALRAGGYLRLIRSDVTRLCASGSGQDGDESESGEVHVGLVVLFGFCGGL